MTALLAGAAMSMNGTDAGNITMLIGLAIIVVMLFGWFGQVVKESVSGYYNSQVDTSFRMGMAWFIFSEVMFFAAFFGALFYARVLMVPWLGGEGHGVMTNALLWQGFDPVWPTNGPANLGGGFDTVPAFGVPLVNTLILLTSGLTVTMAHWALKLQQRRALVLWLAATVALGFFSSTCRRKNTSMPIRNWG